MELVFRQHIRTEMDLHLTIHKTSNLLKDLGFPTIAVAKLSTSVSELGYNILKYAKEGYFNVEKINYPRLGVRVVAIDQGPGIEDIEAALQDSFSTSGTLGLGLPGVRRMMDEFNIKSEFGKGTEVSIVIYKS
ncbi:anti-sigma regulatory factor [Saprospira grandis]|uniref:Switch protein/serine-threonine kinase controls the activity of the piezosome (Stressosome) n=1 Tax=Saprospira grandis (strain Lewin) TaxID=984262 RepID=H6L0Y4_SAPGL|nr:anti-sigma regulatory factor [Saprospira grandis]AFC25940.1 switch protein/serine-threonine kinase; controls the activity of the piezosome (stressosome) [Saprospira grandis str. Lewin]